MERAEFPAIAVDLDEPLRSIEPTVDIFPLSVLKPEPRSVRLESFEAESNTIVSYWTTDDVVTDPVQKLPLKDDPTDPSDTLPVPALINKLVEVASAPIAPMATKSPPFVNICRPPPRT